MSYRVRTVAAVLGLVVLPIRAQTTVVSVRPADPYPQSSAGEGSISDDGRFVAFDSTAPAQFGGYRGDIYVHDRTLGTSVRASVSSAGVGAVDREHSSFSSRISADGRHVAFVSSYYGLVPGDTNDQADVFVRDLQAGVTERVSLTASGQEIGVEAMYPDISGDGRFVIFTSTAATVVPDDTNGAPDVFVRDRLLATTKRVSVRTDGGEVSGVDPYTSPRISDDGRYVAFVSDATNLVQDDTNGQRDVFVRDLVLNTTTRASLSDTGTQSIGSCDNPSISGDGRYVAFYCSADDLVAGDTNNGSDVFVRDRELGRTRRVSLLPGGSQVVGTFVDVGAMSPDGRYVSYMVGFDSPRRGAYLMDLVTGVPQLVSLSTVGVPSRGTNTPTDVSRDGKVVVFHSNAGDLVPGVYDWAVYGHVPNALFASTFE